MKPWERSRLAKVFVLLVSDEFGRMSVDGNGQGSAPAGKEKGDALQRNRGQ